MMFDLNSLLTAEELTKPRTPTELSRWWEDKNRLFADCPEAKKWALLRKGLFKKFYEELYPLSLFATHLYAGRSDIQVIPNLDNRDFDAIIMDYSTSPPSELKVEITSAVEGHDQHLRMKYFVEHGHVNVWGTLSASGTEKVGHEIHVENEVIAHTDLLQRTFSLIRTSVERKSVGTNKAQKYGQGHVLIVAFDDWCWFNSKQQDMAALKNFVEEHVLKIPLDFAALYVIGLSGKTFVDFEPPKIQHSPTMQ
jgi:hypothetical protein